MRPDVPGTRRWRVAAVSAAAAAVTVALPATSAPLPTRHLSVTVAPEDGQVLPSAARVAAVTARLRAQGLTVTRGPGLLLEASGRATAAAARRALGDVATVADTAEQVHWKPRQGVIGNDLLQAYGVPSAPLTPIAPPALTGQTPIIASLQLSSWSQSDLSQFAATQGVGNGYSLYSSATQPCPAYVAGAVTCYDPVASQQYSAVTVGTPGSGDASEVALDQETLLAVAPRLKQRAYFASNESVGTGSILSAFNQVLADVASGLPIIAMTTSWGNCEDTSATANGVAFGQFEAQLEQTLRALNSAGVTVFAASGDAGAYDCAPDAGPGAPVVPDAGYSTPAVDYPCSSPWVECAGGTTHPNRASPPAPDTAWEYAASDCIHGGQCGAYKGSGSGGGASAVFPRPSWQAGVTTGNQRLVPDFALDGDPQTGIQVVVDGNNGQIGGTSLSAPSAAAMVSDIVAAHLTEGTRPRGLGDIHAALYAHPDAFVDVVAPATSTAIQPAKVGYDESTGLGTPNWGALFSAIDITAPTVKVTSWKRTSTTGTTLAAAWTATDASGIKAVAVAVTQQGQSKPVTAKLLSSTSRTFSFTGKPGRTYTLTVYASDPSNNLGQAGSAPLTLPFDDRAAALSAGWSRKKNSHAYASTVSVSAAQGATARATVTGRTVGVAVDYSPASGIFLLIVDGKPVKTVDTGGATRWAVPVTVTRKAGKHTIVVKVLGAHAHGSAAKVSLDAIIAR